MDAMDPSRLSLDPQDPDERELIEFFLGELPERVRLIHDAMSEEDHERLSRIAHQLKGAAPGFGFQTIGDAAAQLESAIKELNGYDSWADRVSAQVSSLVEECESFIRNSPL